MPKVKQHAAMVGGSADDVEAAFYEALQTADIEKLMACWADEDEIVCVHPGGPRVVGTGAIRAAFEALFANGSIRATALHVRKVVSMTSAVHNVVERIEVMLEGGPAHAYVLATNVYHRTSQGWCMVAHHASPGMQNQAQEVNETPHVLH
jgi:ketosteroid isomerase-like protein